MESQLIGKLTRMGSKMPIGVNINNFMQASNNVCEGCPSVADSCEDTATKVLTVGEQAATFTGFVIDAVTVSFPTPVATTNAKLVEAAIIKALETIEQNIVVDVRYSATTSTITVSHVGQSVISALILSTATTIALTRKCTFKTVCASKLSVVGVLTSLIYNGVTTTLTDAAWSATPATNVTTAATLAGQITPALVGTSFAVTVVPNTTSSKFDVTITGDGYFSGTIAGDLFANCGCVESFA